jgi:hypothetical protein
MYGLRTTPSTTATIVVYSTVQALLSSLGDGLATRTRTTTALPFLISRLSTVALNRRAPTATGPGMRPPPM